MREVVVSAAASDGTLRTTPHSLSIVTSTDIERSTATTIGELLAREANVNLQSVTGGDKRATVDIRGMGAAAGSNVLVLVDGVRLNESDLSGADLSTIPMSQIERIEILRGGGAVLFGNGAVGGVINILTRRTAGAGTQAEVSVRRESYDTTDLRVGGSTRLGAVEARLDASRFDSDGFRANSDVAARNVAATLRYSPSGALSFLDLYARAAIHRDTSGLPGPVSASTFASGTAGRRSTTAPLDESRSDDRRVTLGGYADLGARGVIELRFHRRDRDNPFVIGASPAIPIEHQRSSITASRQDLQLRYDREFRAFGRTHTLTAGSEVLSADYVRAENGQAILDSSTRRSGNVSSAAAFAAATLLPTDAVSVLGGVRLDRFETHAEDTRYTRGDCRTITETTLVDVDPGPGVVLVPVPVTRQLDCVDAYRPQGAQGGAWRNRALEFGVTWQASPSTTMFASMARHYRNPNVDELLLATRDLSPQHGTTYEVGLRQAVHERLEGSAAAFLMRVTDEIFFGSDALGSVSLNRNLAAPTRRFGGELEVRWRATRTVNVRANGGYVVPKFAGSGADLPLVPRTTAGIEVEWAPSARLRWSVSARHAGARADGNDFTNRALPGLPSYTVFDAALRIDQGDLQIAFGVRNLFDRAYATVAYSGSLYPMPERNAYVSVRWQLR